MGHPAQESERPQGAAQGVVYDAKEDLLEGGADHRAPDSAAIGR
jgi:hypothetical protein